MEGTIPPEILLTTLSATNPDTRLGVALCTSSAGHSAIELRRLTWGEGIGWYRQQTLRLKATEAEGLLQTLRHSRNQWSDRPRTPTDKVIPFPTAATQHRQSRRKTA